MDYARIMIVEDNTTVAEDCRDFLESLGYGVTSIVASGEESIERAEAERPDAVLMDILLRDEMDGIKAAEQIHTRFEVPVVFLSAYSDRELLERAKRVGSFGYLVKPFEERELCATLEMALYKAKAEKKHRQMEARLRQAQKMEAIGTLAGGIAHDFNNLLTVITGNIFLAQADIKPESEASENLKEAEKAAIRAKELTTRLITFSKGGSPVKEPTLIGDLLKDSICSSLSGFNIKCEFSLPANTWLVTIDKGQIKQVIHNIATNSGEAMGGKGRLKVYCENVDIAEQDTLPLDKGKYIKISIEDQGCGIPEKNIKKIFDPYFSTKEMGTEKGQGLGLAICYSIIRKHNGAITVKSDFEVGSTFSIYLPASEKKIAEPEHVTSTLPERPVTGKGKILVMDDEAMIRKFACQGLRRLGYDVEVCTDGVEAIEMYKKGMESEEPFDAVILDLTNPLGMGGVDAIRQLLEIDPEVKGFISTGYSNDPVVTDFKAYGFCGVLEKPYTMVELSNALFEVILREQ